MISSITPEFERGISNEPQGNGGGLVPSTKMSPLRGFRSKTKLLVLFFLGLPVIDKKQEATSKLPIDRRQKHFLCPCAYCGLYFHFCANLRDPRETHSDSLFPGYY